ncbi:hypothetical protein Q2K19_22180 [Micromonospora soli]|uniref:hypothetical protein n=1 Tax=Micromonospora sp. NBRC 110009 TaxID=3061627 RepID=UPI002673CBC9|nr:hypothetical protein [Micromonospora sp. NBRC 110009]WKT96885.1 hypothetical protein Q2K19_22180 [Micromonospora sp. NBRC 110009]
MTTEQDAGRIEYRCEKRGRERRAEVEAEADGILTPRDMDVTEATDGYPKTREDAERVAGEARTVNDATLEDLRCDINEDKQRRVRQIWRDLRREIEQASEPPGCNRPPCAPGADIGEAETDAALAGRIAIMRYEAGALDDYFGRLKAEATALTERASTAASDADALTDEVKNAAHGADKIPFLTRALVLDWRLRPAQLWKGFTVQGFLDCLGDTMDCLRDEWSAITTLSGALAERECNAESKQERAAKLRSGAADELIRRCGAVLAEPTERSVEDEDDFQNGRDDEQD